MACDDESGSYTGICKIPQAEVKKDREFIIELYCVADCQIKLAAYFSPMFNLELGKTVDLSSMDTFGLAELVKI